MRKTAQASLEVMKEAQAQRWPADKVSRRKTSSLVPSARNSRVHSPEQITQIARSIETWGWTVPVLIDEGGGIIAGHARVLAAAELGLDTVPTMTATGWTEEQKRAYLIADNKLSLNAGWDDNILRMELGELHLADFDITLTGFGTMEFEQLNAPAIDPSAEWQGMPEFDQKDKTAFRSLVVHFRDQEGFDAFAALVKQRMTEKTRFIWYPIVEIENYMDKRYAASES